MDEHRALLPPKRCGSRDSPPWEVKPVAVFGVPTGCCGRVAHGGDSRGHTDVRAWGKLLRDALPMVGPGPREKSNPRAAALRGRKRRVLEIRGKSAVMAAALEELRSGHPGIRSPPSPHPRGALGWLCRVLPKCQLKRSSLAFQGTGVRTG